MGAFFVYILKSSVCLIAFYLFFRLLLNKETFHRFNRIALLSILLLSMLIPLCNITIPEQEQTDIHQTILYWEQIVVPDTQTKDNNSLLWVQVMLLIYVVGILFFIGRNIYSLIRMMLLLKASNSKKLDNGVKLITHNLAIAPFSWMKYIVISETDLQENGEEILLHELAHIQNRHSIDLLLADVCVFFQWFNPAAWLMRQELQNIHEYEADETVINKGINAKQYQLLLIKKAVGKRLYSMANSFNHSKLKKRITMMSKQRSKPWARLKYLYILPVAAITISAFARPEVSNQLDEIANVKVNDLTEFVKTKVEENLPGAESSSKENVVVYIVNSNDSVFQENEGEENTTIKVVGAKGSTPKVITMSLNVDTISANEKPLFLIDGKEVNEQEFKLLDVNSVKSINVIKDASAVEKYGEKGKNGVIIITLKNGSNDSSEEQPISGNSFKIKKIKEIKRGNAILAVDSINYNVNSNHVNLNSLRTNGKVTNIIVNGKRINTKQTTDSTTNVIISIRGKGNINKDSVIVVTGRKLNNTQN